MFVRLIFVLWVYKNDLTRKFSPIYVYKFNVIKNVIDNNACTHDVHMKGIYLLSKAIISSPPLNYPCQCTFLLG